MPTNARRSLVFTVIVAVAPALALPLRAAGVDVFPRMAALLGPEQDLLPRRAAEADLRDAVREVPSFKASLRRLHSDDPELQLQAVRELARPNHLRAVPYLGALFLQTDADRGVRGAAALALGRIGDWNAISFLAQGLDDVDEQIRFTTALALGRLRHSDGVALLETKTLKDPNWWVRYAGTIALGQAKNPAAEPALLAALSDSEWQVRQQAARSLGEYRSQRAREALATALKDEDPAVRYAAARELGEVGTLDSIDTLRDAWSSEREETTRAMMSASLKRLVSPDSLTD
ncbi:MAG: HEAT repeat domain-containing protein [Elusimicrobiota bacterium]|jgi:HEAT repeat protein